MKKHVIVLPLLLATAAHADLGDQLAKILADDGAPYDGFGFDVAIDGTTGVVGARFDGNDGINFGHGSVHVYDLSDPTTPALIVKLLADEGDQNEAMGTSVAISGTTVIAGAPEFYADVVGGAAYLFDLSTGKQIARLAGNDSTLDDAFGMSVGIDAGIAVVGAVWHDAGPEESGAAYLFDAATGDQLAKLVPDDAIEFGHFGQAVAIAGHIAVVTAYNDDDNGPVSGSAYVFDITDQANPVQRSKLLAEDGEPGDSFGFDVAISGTTVIVGSNFSDAIGPDSGAAYLFDVSDPANPTQLGKINPPDPIFYFATSVGLSGSTAIIGAYFDSENGEASGSAYLFDVSDPANPVQLDKLLAADGQMSDFFGRSVAIDGPLALAGAFGDDDNGAEAGSVYVFEAVTCAADINGDGNLNVLDFVAFQLLWQAADPAADCDDNGAFNILDFVCFQQLFQAGCP